MALTLFNNGTGGGVGGGSVSSPPMTPTVQSVSAAVQQLQGKNLRQLGGILATAIVGGIVGTAVAAFLSAIGLVRGKTERVSGAEATRIANELAPAFYRKIVEVSTPEQVSYLSEHLPGKVLRYIVDSDWWNEREIDNVRTSAAFYEAVKNAPISNPWRIERSIWELIHWAAKNSPKDLTDFQPHLQQIFNDVVGQTVNAAANLVPDSFIPDLGTGPAPGSGAQKSGGMNPALKLLIGSVVGIGSVFGLVKVLSK